MNQLLGFDEKYLRLSNHPLAYWKTIAAWNPKKKPPYFFLLAIQMECASVQYSGRETAGMG